jgi:DNA-binding transcriptional MocR family regulator
MLNALERYFPDGCSWTRPAGGLFLWARVPEWIDTTDLLKRAVEYKVAYVPGGAFFAEPSHGRNTMRLNFSNAEPAQIEEGIGRLGNILRQTIAERDVRTASTSVPVPA